MKSEAIRSRIPSELGDNEVRAIRADNRLQREIAEAYGLTSSAVSLIKARKCRGNVPDAPAPAPVAKVIPEAPAQKIVKSEIKVTVCPPAQAAGHKPFARGRIKLKTNTDSGNLSFNLMRDIRTNDVPSIAIEAHQQPAPIEHYSDDWFLL